MTEGRKDDAGKPRPTLVMRTMANALQQVLAVAEYGARKYSPDNWLQVPDAVQRYTDAMLRHQQAHLRGEGSLGYRLWSVLMFQAWLQEQEHG